MTDVAKVVPTFSEEQRKALFTIAHPAYTAHQDDWAMAFDAYDGERGFANGDYLDRYPREEEPKYKERKAKARYHNYVEALVDMYVRKIFSHKVTRDTTSEELKTFWDDVTGAGVSMSAFMAEALAKALAGGHLGVLCDKTTDAPTGPAKADEKARPILVQYLATEIQDWRTRDDRTTLTAVKLREAKPSPDVLSEHATGDDAIRMLVWTAQYWARVEKAKDAPVQGLAHNLTVVPFAVLAPKPSKTWPGTGKPLCAPKIVKALYNRCSEEDEVLRDQAFSLFTVNVPPEGDVEKVKNQIGGDIGTTRAMVLQGEADFITPDQAVPESIRKNIAYLVQELYRMAHMRFQRDSLEAETAEAIQLKHDELNAALASMAEACQALELQIARFFFAWTAATPEAAQAAFDSAKVNVTYATEFFLQDLESELKAWILAVKQELGATIEKRIKVRIVKRLEPDLDEDTMAKVEGEIDAIIARPKPDPVDLANSLRAAAVTRLKPPPVPEEGATA